MSESPHPQPEPATTGVEIRAPRLLHHTALAILWSCSVKTILRAIHRGDLPAVRMGAKTYLIAEVDAAAFYATRSRGLSSSGASLRGGRPWGSCNVSPR